jgi:hypothetical protein
MLLDWKKVYLTVWLTLPASSYLLHYIAIAAILCAFSGAHLSSFLLMSLFLFCWKYTIE